jgi:hypothetical protein
VPQSPLYNGFDIKQGTPVYNKMFEIGATQNNLMGPPSQHPGGFYSIQGRKYSSNIGTPVIGQPDLFLMTGNGGDHQNPL